MANIYKYNLQRLQNSVQQSHVFSTSECEVVERLVDELVKSAKTVGFNKRAVDEVPLRTKYFFGEGYIYGQQLMRKGPGTERLYPHGYVNPIPKWIYTYVITPLVNAQVTEEGFINSVVINDYQPGGCIVSHIDPIHIFDRPIISLSLFSDSTLCFGCKFDFKPIRCSEPFFKLPLPRGIVTTINGYAANKITHCIRPEDVKCRRVAIILRRVLPTAPRLTLTDPILEQTHYENQCFLYNFCNPLTLWYNFASTSFIGKFCEPQDVKILSENLIHKLFAKNENSGSKHKEKYAKNHEPITKLKITTVFKKEKKLSVKRSVSVKSLDYVKYLKQYLKCSE